MRNFCIVTLSALALAIAFTPDAEARGCRGDRGGFFSRLKQE